MICIIKTVIGYVILMFIGTNILGLVFRGLVPSYQKDSKGDLVLADKVTSRGSIALTILCSIVMILYFIALVYYWSIGVVIAAVMLMIARVPDLLYELKTGEKITAKNVRKRPIDIVCTIISWAALPVLWYSLCYTNRTIF